MLGIPMDSELKNVRFSLPATEREDFPKDYDSMTKYLANVFQEKTKGNEQPYNELLHIISQSPTSPQRISKLQVKLLVQALSLFVSSLNHKMQSLVNAILQMDWLDQEQNFISMYLHLVQNIVSAQSSYVVPVTQTIVQYIRTGQKKYPNIPLSILFEQIHSALAKILRLIPAGPSFILPILSKSVPHKSEPLSSISFYVKSLLSIAEYAPVIRVQLMEIIIDLVVQMDIDIQIEDIEDELENENVFAMDDFEVEHNVQSEDSDSDSDASSQIITSDYKVMITKLDTVMQLAISYISNIKKLDDQNLLNETFFGILSSFDKIMLPTHKLRSAQFIVFYTSSLIPEYPEEFMGLLVTHLLNVSSSSVLRESAASYLGSFIARAKHVGVVSVKHCLKLLNQLCQSYIDSYEHELVGQLQVDRFGVLYSSVQAILYIFCFRWKQIMIVEDRTTSGAFPPELSDFQRVLLSKFSPLRVCSEAIVQEFAKIAHHLNIMYCYPLINASASRSNTSIESIQSQTKSQELSIVSRLESFFPFDPLVLPQCKLTISKIYQEWDGEDESDIASDGVTDSDLENSLKGMSLDERYSYSMSHSHSFGNDHY